MNQSKKEVSKVIKKLDGHGVGRSLREQPDKILNYRNRFDQRRFKKNSRVAIETFISTICTFASELKNHWITVGDKGSFMTQYEQSIILTEANQNLN